MAKKKTKKLKKKVKKQSLLHSETKRSILAIVFFASAVLSFLSFFNGAGRFGYYFLKFSKLFFGQGFFLIPLFFVLIALAIIAPRLGRLKKHKPVYRAILIGITLFILSILATFHLFNSGGYLGFILGYPLLELLGFWASLIILISLLIISVLVIFNLHLPLSMGQKEEEKEEIKKDEKPVLEKEEKKKSIFWSKFKKQQKAEPETPEENQPPLEEKKAAALPVVQRKGDFKLPSLEFLEKEKGHPTSGDIKANLNIIKQTLDNFGIEVEMAEVNVGPTVTQYTLRPAQGIKLARITALQNDLALALAAHPLRIEAPIPGRSLVGIEIPNRSIVLVRLRDLLERSTFEKSPSFLTFGLGRDVAGNPVFADLAKMPHLLVAGATGTGKTIALNNLIISLLYRNYPENLKLILVDPKRVELTAYNSIPHLMAPVVVQADKAVNTLHWAVSEMERRFETLQQAGRRDIDSYNRSLPKEEMPLPYIVIVIDELADLMSSHGREVEATIVRLAQMARAVGIHLVVSTQRPSVEVITGLIKANITSRMAFQVASQVDSRTILDMSGSEKLLGNGDMLFLAGNSAKPRRIQGAYITDQEVRKITDYLRESQAPDYNEEVLAGRAGGSTVPGLNLETEGRADDELYDEAQQVIVQAGKASASLLQRRLRIGYARAARLLDILEEKGVVGPAEGAKPRDVYIDQGEDNYGQ